MSILSSIWNGVKKGVGFLGDVAAGSGIPIVSGVGSAVGNLIDEEEAKAQHKSDLNWSAQQAQINRDFQTSERIAAQEYQLDMWNMSNEYNSPEKQLERAAKAGINLNDVIGKGASAYAQPMTSQGQAGSTASFPNGSLATALLTSDAVVQNLLAQAKNTESDTNLKEQEYNWNAISQPLRYNLMLKEYERLGKEIEKYDVDIDVAKGMFDWYSKLTEEEIKIKRQNLNNLRNENLEILQRIKESKSRENLNYAQSEVAKEQAEYLDQQTYESIHRTSLIDEQAATEGLKNDLLTIQKEFSNISGIPLGTSEFEGIWHLWSKGELWKFLDFVSTQGIQNFVKETGTQMVTWPTMLMRSGYGRKSFFNR